MSEQQRREEAECLSALLLEKEEGSHCCSTTVDDSFIEEEAHVTVGLFRLCEEWDVSGALHHFLAATTCNYRHRGGSLEEQEEEDMEGQVPHKGGFGWGAVWLAQASVFTILW